VLLLIPDRATYFLWVVKGILQLAARECFLGWAAYYVEIPLAGPSQCLIKKGESLTKRDDDQLSWLLNVSRDPPQSLFVPLGPSGVFIRIPL